MDSVIFHLDSDGIDKSLLKTLKSLFKGRRITLTVTPDPVEITDQSLIAAISSNDRSKTAYSFSGDEFDQLANSFANDPNVDLIKEIKKHEVKK